MFSIKRIYDKPSHSDGLRVLVDRLWPRGIKKEEAAVDLWMKEIAPSASLRQWFGHKPERWDEFVKRYREELNTKKELLLQLKEWERKKGKVTLLFSAKDFAHNNAVALSRILNELRVGKGNL